MRGDKNMRLGCAVSTYPTKFGPIVFKDGELEKNFEIMRKYGFSGVDLFVNNTSPEVMRQYKKTMEDYDIKMATYLAIFLAENGVKLSEKDPAKRVKNIELVKAQLDNARFFDARGLAMGFIRGGYEEGKEEKSDAMKRIAEALTELGEYAHSIGTKILLEPINRYEINTINTAVEGADFINDNKLKGIGLLIDAFHMNIEDKNIGDSIRYCGEHAVNMHMADSNRYALGEGHLDMKEVLVALNEIKFNGFLTLEAFVKDAEKDLCQTRQALRLLESELGFKFEE